MSKSNRFKPVKKETYFGPDFFDKDAQKPMRLPDSTFMSKI